ncbi:MAG: DUF2264 domain-containing protein [Flavisolibacter sp.]
MKQTLFVLVSFTLLHLASAQESLSSDRKLWLDYMDRVARPVLSNLAQDRLKEKMPVELSIRVDNAANRSTVTYLEALGRTLSGLAPWLQLEGGSREETALRKQYRDWSLKAVTNAVNPKAKDYLKWNGGQPLVDASFLAFALVRSPWLWEHLDSPAKENLQTAFRTTRTTVPVYSNWLLFSAMIEAFFCKYGMDYDAVRVDYAVREFAQHWYVGDGMFSDGMQFHMDYYNSIVIHPFLATIVTIMNEKNKSYLWFSPRLDQMNKRYAEILERMINTDGSYPVIGRSIVYRAGVFHHLADISLRKQLPESLRPAQIRGALTALIQKTFSSSTTFKNGWLTIGVYGAQPDLAEGYITTGSLYLCADIFLPLGLPDTDEFWSGPSLPWTSVRLWKGEDVPADHALDLK